MPNRSSKKDENELAKSVIDEIIEETENERPEKNPAAVELGRLGGKKGGKARAAALTPEQRKDIAQRAAKARWAKRDAPEVKD